ncbi:MAG: hypothetical protein ACE5ID_00115 [Acidobacteriota bacterium]
MSFSPERWFICPGEDCLYALEYEPDQEFYCPTCEMELISQCPTCKKPIESEEQVTCRTCRARLKV